MQLGRLSGECQRIGSRKPLANSIANGFFDCLLIEERIKGSSIPQGDFRAVHSLWSAVHSRWSPKEV
jgi:hypothetical protein